MAEKIESKTEKKEEKGVVDAKPIIADNKEKIESKTEKKEIKVEKKEKKIERPKKSEAIAKGTNMHASKRHCMYICSFIKNKPIDRALKELQEVIILKRAIPFKGEIPHRHELGGKPGRYPINASKEFIYLLKALKGNSIENGLDIDKTRIYFASATWSSRQSKRGGARFKRAFVLLKAKEFNEIPKSKEAKK
ncbi:MAG: hypothetical protein AABX85_01650 [Nanoarchaeota archaeon]